MKSTSPTVRFDRNSAGFTLIEIIVVILIISILLTMASLNFGTWETKYRIGDQAREMMQDLSSMRMSAIQTKSTYMAILTASNTMTFRQYTTNEQITPTNGKQVFSKPLHYPVSNNPTGSPSCSNLQIDSRGYTIFPLSPSGNSAYPESWQFLYVLPTGTAAAYDCLAISNLKINLGKYNGTACAFK